MKLTCTFLLLSACIVLAFAQRPPNVLGRMTLNDYFHRVCACVCVCVTIKNHFQMERKMDKGSYEIQHMPPLLRGLMERPRMVKLTKKGEEFDY